MNDQQKLLASTLVLVHLFAFLLAPWLHVHPEEDHGHVEGSVGHAHISAIAEEAHHHSGESHAHLESLESWHDHGHSIPTLPVAIPVYTVVSKFRINISLQIETFAYALVIVPHLSALIPSQLKFLPEDNIPFFILSNRILSVTDLPPPTV